MTKVQPKIRYTIQSIGQKIDSLIEVVGLILVEQTTMKQDITELKTDVAALKTDVSVLKMDVSILKSDVATMRFDLTDLREDLEDFRTEANQKFDYIQEDIRVVLPDHEVRIAHLEGRRASI